MRVTPFSSASSPAPVDLNRLLNRLLSDHQCHQCHKLLPIIRCTRIIMQTSTSRRLLRHQHRRRLLPRPPPTLSATCSQAPGHRTGCPNTNPCTNPCSHHHHHDQGLRSMSGPIQQFQTTVTLVSWPYNQPSQPPVPPPPPPPPPLRHLWT